MNPELFITFLLITVVLILTPGPVVTLVIATGATDGVRAALATVLGTTVGNALLIGAVAFGLSFVLASSALLFDVIRYVGAAYLVWLGSSGARPGRGRRWRRRADMSMPRADLSSRCRTRKRPPSLPPSCRSSSIRRCRPSSSLP